ncbi:MAG: polyphosphate kinase 2 [Saprospiraceae bacterium]|nr:polyphosphate kinase 2 [Saprospiraceae bacterium]
MKYKKSDLKLLGSKRGLLYLREQDKPDFDGVLERMKFEKKLIDLQVKLIKKQNSVIKKNKRVLIIVEGGEFAGKGTLIKYITNHLNPRSVRTVALPKPTETDRQEWYFRRYVKHLPVPGEIVIFDRSWYNRAIVEPVNGFCTPNEYKKFISEVNHFESMIHKEGLYFLKFYLQIGKKKQAERIDEIRNDPLRKWEFTEVDRNAQKLWQKFKRYEKRMFDLTSTDSNPWHIMDANDLNKACLDTIKMIVHKLP